MSSESTQGRVSSVSLNGRGVESSPEFAQSTHSEAAKDIEFDFSLDLPIETKPLAADEGVMIFVGEKHGTLIAMRGEQGMWTLGSSRRRRKILTGAVSV